jgi:hypothetical protein
MKRKIAWAVVLVISHLLVLVMGFITANRASLNRFVRETETIDAQVTLGHYTIYRDIAIDLKAGRYDRIKCSAELAASSMLDDIKTCLASQACKSAIEKTAKASAPEVLGEAPLQFAYIESKGGLRHCGEKPPAMPKR